MSGNVLSRDRAGAGVAAGPFQVHFAVGTEARVAEYRLRYRAFVEEHHWESASACRGGLECDEFDPFSCSALLTDSVTGETAACQRLILPERLPYGLIANVEREYRPLSSRPATNFAELPRTSWAEVSRLTIAPRYRWGSDGTSLPAMVAITYASMALAIALNRTVLFSLSDPRTARLSRRMGFTMHQVGEAVDFHGLRATFRIDVADVRHSVCADWHGTVERLVTAASMRTGTRLHSAA